MQLQNGSDHKDKWNVHVIYGYIISPDYESVLTPQERKQIYDKSCDKFQFYTNYVKKIKITEETERFRFFITGSSFTTNNDEIEGEEEMLIIGIPTSKLKSRHSGVVNVWDTSLFESDIKIFLKDNPQFKQYGKPQMLVYTNMDA
jgi:hypothetical protein